MTVVRSIPRSAAGVGPQPRYRASFFNLRVGAGATTLLFNGVTGALLRLNKGMARDLAPWLGAERSRKAGVGYSDWAPPAFSRGDLPPRLARQFDDFVDSGVFVPEDLDERADLRSAYARHRSDAPFFVTITTTLDCNMRCYYCYQKDGQLDYMSPDMCDAIIDWTKAEIEKHGYPRIYVDWYGGEPMLNQEVIERFSAAIIPFCAARGVSYKASLISNGTSWPQDPIAFVKRNEIHNIQFSLDGPERHHNKRRGTIDPKAAAGARTASFDTVMSTIGALVGSARIYLRVNVDPWVGWDSLEVIDDCARRGWLEPETRFYPYVAVINAMTEHCGFIAKAKQFDTFYDEFSRIQLAFYEKLRAFRDETSLEIVQYYPNRVTINCAAVNNHAMMFGPNGRMYKCGLDVGDHHRAHATLGLDGAVTSSAAETGPAVLAADRWDRYDPFTHPTCRECQYLPVCMGGCPKAHIERDTPQIKAQSEFWEANFDRIVREYHAAAGGH